MTWPTLHPGKRRREGGGEKETEKLRSSWDFIGVTARIYHALCHGPAVLQASARAVLAKAPCKAHTCFSPLHPSQNDAETEGPCTVASWNFASLAPQPGAGPKAQAPTTAPHCLSPDALPLEESGAAPRAEARGFLAAGSGGERLWGAGEPANPGPAPLVRPPRTARSCRGAATRWQQTLCDRAAGGSARRGRGAGLGSPPATRPGSRAPSSGRPPGLCGAWRSLRRPRNRPRIPRAVLGPPPRAAVPGTGASRRGRAAPLGGRPGSWATPAIKPRGPGRPGAEGREPDRWPAGSQAGGSVQPGGGRGLSPVQTPRKLMAPGSRQEATGGRGQSRSPNQSPCSKAQARPHSRGRPSHPTVPRAWLEWSRGAFGQEWAQGLLGKSQALSELGQGGVLWRGGCRQTEGAGLPTPSRWKEPQGYHREHRTFGSVDSGRPRPR